MVSYMTWGYFNMKIVFPGISILKSNVRQSGDGYRQISDIRCAKSEHLYVSRLILQLFLPNPLKPVC